MIQLVGVEDSARLLGVSPWTIRAWVRAGKLRPIKLCRRLLLEQTELERFVESARSNRPPQEPEIEGKQI
jgi:excisionase family DNA binding protein